MRPARRPQPIDVAFPSCTALWLPRTGNRPGKLECSPYVARRHQQRLGMDKEYTRHTVLAEAAGSTAAWVRVGRDEWMRDPDAIVARTAASSSGVRQARAGGVLGGHQPRSGRTRHAAIDAARLLIRRCSGNRWPVSRWSADLGGIRHGPRASHTGEIVMHTEDRFYDYRAKYLPEEQVDLRVPAGPALERRVRELGTVQAFTARTARAGVWRGHLRPARWAGADQ